MSTIYHFGFIEHEIRAFAYPRVGSHFFNYALTGLFDVVSPPHSHLENSEAVERQNELNPDALYALSLREPGIAFRPLRLNPQSTGVHGFPQKSDFKTIVLIRDPIATAYSRYRVERDRWKGLNALTVSWLRNELSSYANFYDRSLDVLAHQGDLGLLMRWEDMVASSHSLERLVRFIGIAPKLRCSFVWSVLQFERFVKPCPRTFYRSGKNNEWTRDVTWLQTLSSMTSMSFERFGYHSVSGYLGSQDFPVESTASEGEMRAEIQAR